MISIIQRLKNIWKLSDYQVSSQGMGNHLEKISEKIETKPKMAQIIHLKDEEKIINEILNEK